VTEIESGVSGRSVGEIDVPVELENSEVWFCYWLNYQRFTLTVKAAQNLCWRVVMLPGIEWYFLELRGA
jgi:hypothetical protein